MAPTEILAEQHFMTFQQLLAPLGVSRRAAHLLRSRRASATRGAPPWPRARSACAVGTHALVQEGVAFRRLGLAVVDEQHRFGVAQRARLRDKGESSRPAGHDGHAHPAHAGPDPLRRPRRQRDRRAASRPPARHHRGAHRGQAEGDLQLSARPRSGEGRQIYVVYPLVEESEVVDLEAATDMARRLQREVFPDLTVGLLHGRLGFEDKDAIMRRFKAGEIHVLVSTTVIEVGIDVPNASVMLIEHAERFGLSQLHQLRGRVGRGPWKSYCILLTAAAPRGGRPATHRRHGGHQRRLPHRRGRPRAARPRRVLRHAPVGAARVPRGRSPARRAPSWRRRAGRRWPSSRADPELRDPEHRGLAREPARALARQAPPRPRRG